MRKVAGRDHREGEPDQRQCLHKLVRIHLLLHESVFSRRRLRHSRGQEERALHIASLRCCFCRAPAAFFDDTGIVDIRASARSAQLGVQLTFGAAGTKLDPEKTQTMATQRVYLGLRANVGMAHTHGMTTFDLKSGFSMVQTSL